MEGTELDGLPLAGRLWRVWWVCVGWGAVAGAGCVLLLIASSGVLHPTDRHDWNLAPALSLWSVMAAVGAGVGVVAGAVMGAGAVAGLASAHQRGSREGLERDDGIRAARRGLVGVSPVVMVALWSVTPRTVPDAVWTVVLIGVATWFGVWRLDRSMRGWL